METLKNFVKDRDEMLLKCSVKELKKFVFKYRRLYGFKYVSAIIKADNEVLEITLHKSIVNCINLPSDFRLKSEKWLISRGYTLAIGGAK